jgi:hypothetical protein
MFYEDMNFDGSVTISDVWIWVKWAYFYLGDLFLYCINLVLPEGAKFFELTCNSYGGWVSGLLSPVLFFVLFWVGAFLLILLINVLEAVRKLFAGEAK